MVCRHLNAAILTGPTFSGKTGALTRWAAGRMDVAGLLSPDGPEGRSFVDLVTGERMAMTAGTDEAQAVAVGRFRFRTEAFAWANTRLTAAAAGPRPIIVIDEIGPLELRGAGLQAGLQAALARAEGRLILVVRETLVEEVKRSFSITHAESFTTESWPHAWQGDTSAS